MGERSDLGLRGRRRDVVKWLCSLTVVAGGGWCWSQAAAGD